MTLKLHFAPNSRASRISWLLEELKLPYELNLMAFHPKDLKSDEHRARHPLGRVPVLDDGEISIFESGAIVDYILERHKNDGLKPAVDSPHFAPYLQWFHYCEGMVMPPVNTIVVHTLLLPPERRDDAAFGANRRVAASPRAGCIDQRERLLPDRGGIRCRASSSRSADADRGHALVRVGQQEQVPAAGHDLDRDIGQATGLDRHMG